MDVRIYIIAAIFLLQSSLFPQDSPVKKVRQKMADSLGLTQDFLCTATIESNKLQQPLRIDTGLINGKELVAWPETDAAVTAVKELLSRYQDAGIGTFAIYTHPLFRTNAATFYPSSDGALEFGMPPESARYAITANGKRVALGYSGKMWFDAGSGDLIKLELHPDNLPADSGFKDITQTIEYQRKQLGLPIVILPTSSTVVIQKSSGETTRIASKIEACRLYTTKAGMRFIEGVVETEPEAVAGQKLPPKTRVELTFDEAVDEKSSAVGAPVSFKVSRDVKVNGAVVIKKGATAKGKITRISRQSYRAMDSMKGYYIVGILLQSIDAGGQQYAVEATLDRMGPAANLDLFLPFSPAPDKWGIFEDIRDQLDFPKPLPGEAIIGVVREYMRIPKGVNTVWVTN